MPSARDDNCAPLTCAIFGIIHKNMSEEKTSSLDLSALGAFDFTPAWAKAESKVSVAKPRASERPSRRFEKAPRPSDERAPRERAPRPFARRDRFARAETRVEPLDCEIKVLPETKALGTIIRKLQSDTHAYKLKELAYFFLDNPASILLKITPTKDDRFFQCKACGFASTKEEDVLAHAVSAHLADYYEAKEIDCEMPKGNFTCVAKCGLSGVLLGPPNAHEFNATVREMLRTKFPQMTESEYRAHIEMVHDAEAIEAWRQGAVRKTVFTPKGDAEAAPLSREQAEGEFRRLIAPSLIQTPKHLMMTAAEALKCPVASLVVAARNAIEAERRAPAAMCFALRGAFHNRKLNFFRANDMRGPEFVLAPELKVFDAEHAIAELAAASRFIAEHPCCDKSEFPKDVPDFEQHVKWLVETGHAIAFTNGVFSAVEKFPKYGPQWKKRVKKPEVRDEGAPQPDAVAEESKKEEISTEEVKRDETAPVVAQ